MRARSENTSRHEYIVTGTEKANTNRNDEVVVFGDWFMMNDRASDRSIELLASY